MAEETVGHDDGRNELEVLRQQLAALRQDEQWLREALNNLDDGYYAVTMEGTILRHNRAFARILGLDENGELTGKRSPDFWRDPADRSRYVAELVAAGSVENFEARAKRSDGTPICVLLSAHMVRDEGGAPLRIEGTVRDVTAQELASQALRERVKELACLHAVGKTIEAESGEIGRILERTVALLPDAWCHPESAVARISVDEESFATGEIDRCVAVLRAPLRVGAEVRGSVEVGYLVEHPEADEGPFLKEERSLADSIAERIGHVIGRFEDARTLERERETLRAVLDGVDDVIYVADPDSHELLHVNAAFERGWGEGHVGKKCYRVLQNRDEPCPFCTNDKIFGDAVGRTHVWEFQNEVTKAWFRCSDKAIRWVDGRLVRFELASDVTPVKQTLQALRESEELNRTLVASLPQKIFLKDRSSRYLMVNDRYARDFDLGPGDFVGKDDFAFHPPELAEKYRADDAAVMESGEVKDIEEPYTAAGEQRWIHTVKAPVVDDEGEVVGLFGMFSDVTEQKQARDALAASKRELEIRNRIAQVFLTAEGEETYSEVLAIVLDALESKHGVFGFLDEEGALVVPTMTRHIWQACEVADKRIVFPRDEWGDSIWPTALRERRILYSNERSSRTPEGHIPLERNIAAPILHAGEVVGLLQVGNKPTDYTEQDLALIETIANAIAPVLEARIRREREERARQVAEQRLREHQEHLEELVRARTEELDSANRQLRDEVDERLRAELELRRTTNELERQSWVQSGLVRLAEVMAGDPDVPTLATRALSEIARTIDAQIGVLYATSDGPEPILRLVGSYACPHGAELPAELRLGEGLVGQAAKESRTIRLTDVPAGYLRVSSALGGQTARALTITPLRHEDRVKGVLELGTIGAFTEAQETYVSRAAGVLALGLESADARATQAELLAESRRLSEELQAQQEELRVSNEELGEQTARLRSSEERLKAQQEELQVTNEELEEKNDLLVRQKSAVERAQRELSEKADELALASKYKSEFLANMSHELRTPLNSLLLLARSLADNDKGNLSGEEQESARVIYQSGNDLLSLINEILDLSKIEAGRLVLHTEQVRVDEIVGSLKRAFEHVARDKGLELTVQVAAGAPDRLTTDRKRLEQILRNLVSNALKFTEHGSVTVCIGPVPATARPRRDDLGRDRAIAVSVADTGIGIAPAQHKLIFEAFQQADGTTVRRYGGTGLGLSIARELAAALGGEIQLESTPGEGSTFTLYLPLEPHEDARGEASSPPSAAPAARPASRSSAVAQAIADDRADMTQGDPAILVVEDDPTFAAIVAQHCRELGFKVLAAAAGEDAVELARRFVLKGIILDLKLPGMDGWHVLELLKDDPATRHIPVHIVSAEDPSPRAMRKGAVGYTQKPVAAEQIRAALRTISELTSGRQRCVLVVEDDEDVRRGIVKLIADQDVSVDEAAGGAEAIKALRAKRYDCMVLDLGLWDFDGDELLRRIEAEAGIELPPVIVHTARDLSWQEDLDLRAYSDSIIVKGVRSDERLLDEVSLFLHRVVAEMPEKKRRVITSLHDTNAPLRDKKVLIVDDDMRTLFALTKLLADRGMQVVKADNGEKALAMLADDSSIDIVLMDIMMPLLDGYETMKRIRNDPRYKGLPIIALTAKAMRADQDKCIAAGASDYLPKPVDVDRLVSMLRVWLYR